MLVAYLKEIRNLFFSKTGWSKCEQKAKDAGAAGVCVCVHLCPVNTPQGSSTQGDRKVTPVPLPRLDAALDSRTEGRPGGRAAACRRPFLCVRLLACSICVLGLRRGPFMTRHAARLGGRGKGQQSFFLKVPGRGGPFYLRSKTLVSFFPQTWLGEEEYPQHVRCRLKRDVVKIYFCCYSFSTVIFIITNYYVVIIISFL